MHRACPRCGEELTSLESSGGAVYSCAKHGVVAWYFDEAAGGLRATRPLR